MPFGLVSVGFNLNIMSCAMATVWIGLPAPPFSSSSSSPPPCCIAQSSHLASAAVGPAAARSRVVRISAPTLLRNNTALKKLHKIHKEIQISLAVSPPLQALPRPCTRWICPPRGLLCVSLGSDLCPRVFTTLGASRGQLGRRYHQHPPTAAADNITHATSTINLPPLHLYLCT